MGDYLRRSRGLLADLPVLAVWLAAGAGLSAATAKVVDWFVMTDELLYERLAISVAQTGSPLPALHGEHVPNVSQLYPLLLSTVYRHGLVPDSLHDAHVLNAFVMTSAAVPAYLIARQAFAARLPAHLVALLCAVVPWLVLSSFLLTEVAAYPAFLWALYLVQRTVAAPSAANDVLALLGVGLAVGARTQFTVLFLVVPLSVLLHELLAHGRGGLRRAVRAHLLLAAVVAVGTVALVVLTALGRASSLLGTYATTASGNLLPSGTPRSLVEHLATLAVALGILPVLLGGAWLLARVARPTERRGLHAAASVGVVTVVVVLVEVTTYDLRFGGSLVRDRYLFYLAPVFLLGFVGALLDVRTPRWSLAAPAVLVGLGLLALRFPTFEKLNVDTPASSVNDYLLQNGRSLAGTRAMLLAAAALLLVIFYLGRRLAGRTAVAVVLALATLATLGGETAYAFDRLFRVDGTSGRPITLPQGVVFDWIDRTVGRNAKVTMIPYSQIAGDYWASAAWWWDLEFWNVSVVRGAYPHDAFAEIQSTFPKLDLRFDPRTGRASASPTRYVAQSQRESRFAVHGPVVSLTRDVLLIDAGRRWRADWLTFGLDPDGWTKPHVPAVLRVFAAPGQTHAVTRSATVVFQAPNVDAPVHIVSEGGGSDVVAPANGTVERQVSVCVPPHGFGDVRFTADRSAPIYGNQAYKDLVGVPRSRGVLLARISLADELGEAC